MARGAPGAYYHCTTGSTPAARLLRRAILEGRTNQVAYSGATTDWEANMANLPFDQRAIVEEQRYILENRHDLLEIQSLAGKIGCAIREEERRATTPGLAFLTAQRIANELAPALREVKRRAAEHRPHLTHAERFMADFDPAIMDAERIVAIK